MRKASLVKGYIAERLSYFTDSIGKILQLREARAFYRKSKSNEDALRVDKELSEAIKTMEFAHPTALLQSNPAIQRLANITAKCLQTWTKENNENRFIMLAIDFAGIRPSPYDSNSFPNDDPLLADFMTECGIVQKVNISSSDGRINSGKSTTTREEIHNDSQEQILLSFLNEFTKPILGWLKIKRRIKFARFHAYWRLFARPP